MIEIFNYFKKNLNKIFNKNIVNNLPKEELIEIIDNYNSNFLDINNNSLDLEEKILKYKKILKEFEKKIIFPEKNFKINGNYKVDYEKELNPNQCFTATLRDGVFLVIAGAGSGKTRTIIYRVSYLLENGVKPENILMLTFTNKAAKEMQERIEKFLGKEKTEDLTISTFHSFALLLIKKYPLFFNIDNDFKIINSGKSIISYLISELNFESKYNKKISTSTLYEIYILNKKQNSDLEALILDKYPDYYYLINDIKKIFGIYEYIKSISKIKKESLDILSIIQEKELTKNRFFPEAEEITNILSKSKNLKKSIREIILKYYKQFEVFESDIVKIAEKYEEYKIRNNLLDFDDMIEKVNYVLENNKEFRQLLEEKYKYIIVDEYQDTNIPQKELIDYIALCGNNLMVVGDDNQSIYGFRGANFENIFTIGITYPNCKIVKLEQNYRSSSLILNFLNELSLKMQIGYKKVLFTDKQSNVKPKLLLFSNREKEALFIVQQIKNFLEKSDKYNVAILYRSSYDNLFIEKELLKNNIKYDVRGGLNFFEKKHISDFISLLKFLYNKNDVIELNNILSLIKDLNEIEKMKILKEMKEDKKINLDKYFGKKYYSNLYFLANFSGDISEENNLNIIVEYFISLLKKRNTNYEDLSEDIYFLVSIIKERKDITKLFEKKLNKIENEEKKEKVTLSTIHSAKGLEWDIVFVINLIDSFFPSKNSRNNFEDIEEERRLFYVACSRAREYLFMTLPSHKEKDICRFIREIEKKFYDKEIIL